MSNPAVIAELRRIAAENGGQLRPADVVQSAKPKSSPLHSKFEWNDSDAAQAYRLWQARQLISVTVEYVGAGKDAVSSRVFVSLTSDRKDEGGYRDIQAVMSDPDQKKQLLDDAFDDMDRFKKRYSELKELSEVFSVMQKVKTRTKGRQSRPMREQVTA